MGLQHEHVVIGTYLCMRSAFVSLSHLSHAEVLLDHTRQVSISARITSFVYVCVCLGLNRQCSGVPFGSVFMHHTYQCLGDQLCWVEIQPGLAMCKENILLTCAIALTLQGNLKRTGGISGW